MASYTAILESALRYEKKQQAIVGMLFIILFVALCVFGIVRFKRESRSNRIIIFALPTILCIVFFVGQKYNKRFCDRIIADIEMPVFCQYSGSIVHDRYQKDSFYHHVHIFPNSEKQESLLLADYANTYGSHENFQELPDGDCTATIVYGSKSGIIVGWLVEE